jgi:hypothetical protein
VNRGVIQDAPDMARVTLELAAAQLPDFYEYAKPHSIKRVCREQKPNKVPSRHELAFVIVSIVLLRAATLNGNGRQNTEKDYLPPTRFRDHFRENPRKRESQRVTADPRLRD